MTNSVTPPSNLNLYSFFFAVVSSLSVMLTPLFKKASSLILFCKIDELNFIEENISLDGKKVIFVPFFFVLPTFFKDFFVTPSLNVTKYSLLSRYIVKSSFFDKALTTETPTPCKPPETL